MAKTIVVTRRYPYPPELVWRAVADWANLAKVSEPILRYSRMPEGRFKAGQIVDYEVSLYGVGAPMTWRTDIVELDGERMFYRTSEGGGVIRSWRHLMTLSPDGDGTLMRDHVEVDAGWRSWVAALWARKLYTFRHKMRVRRLNILAMEPA